MIKKLIKKVQGFTPVELLVIVAISGLVASALVFSVTRPGYLAGPVNVNINVDGGRVALAAPSKVFDISTGAEVGTIYETGPCKYVGQDKLVCPGTPAQDTKLCLETVIKPINLGGNVITWCSGDQACILEATQECLGLLGDVTVPLREGGTPAIPIAVWEGVWEEDPPAEINILDQEWAPGAFGLLDIPPGSNSHADIVDQIRNGISNEAFSILEGSVDYDIEGNPGVVSGSIGAALEEKIGKVVGLFLYSGITGTGANAVYTITGMRFARVQAVELTETLGERQLIVQPVPYY